MRLGDHIRLERCAALLILLLVLALFWLGPVSTYLDLLAGGAEQLDLKEQTLQRYRALASAADVNVVGPRSELPRTAALLFPEIPESQAVALLQETVKSAAAAAHIQVQGLQVLRTEASPGALRIGVRVRASGDIGSLGQLLYAIEAAKPLLYPDNLQIQSRPMQPAGAAPPLDFQFDVSGFTAGPAT